MSLFVNKCAENMSHLIMMLTVIMTVIMANEGKLDDRIYVLITDHCCLVSD